MLKKIAGMMIADERGSMAEMAWVLGSAVVVVLVIVVFMTLAPQTATTFWNSATSWLEGKFGFGS